MSWSPDGKFFYFAPWRQAPFAVPLRAGQMLPFLPEAGIQSDADVAALPGAKPLPVAGAIAGANPAVYAFVKLTAQRHIYRVPVP